jgi:alpha-D-xyloside xylohydrolase
MQVGTGKSVLPWDLGAETGYDEEMLGWYRTYARLHLRLWPTLWTYVQNLAIDGRAIMRPLGLAYPELSVHPDDVYLLGDFLLVAPVVEAGAVTRTVPFPPGRWIDWWDGTAVEGGETRTVDAPLGKLPLYLAAGGIVALLRPTIDTLAPVGKPDQIDSYATDPGLLYPRLALGSPATFTLFDGTAIGQDGSAADPSIAFVPGTVFSKGAILEILAFGPAKPSQVAEGGTVYQEAASLTALEATPGSWYQDGAPNGSLYIRLGAGAHQLAIVR